MNLPRELEMVESQIRDMINHNIARGRVSVRVTLHPGAGQKSAKLHLNIPLAKAYSRELNKLAAQLKLTGGVTLDNLMRAPGVLQTDEEIAGGEDFWPAVEVALKQALNALLKMREKEGAHLSKDLTARVETMSKSVERVKLHAPNVAAKYREQLLARIKNAGIETPSVDDERLLKEIVFFADRSDISEELTRLASHFQQFEDCVKSKEPVGRTLDFLAQEMNREINTIGSKANDGLISREVVALKTELEKFREQAMNVE
jgi:uncharacterized protein (TIGR00255 family)